MSTIGKATLTTGVVARIANVSPRTVLNWTTRGILKSYRIPGSRHRRIVRADLIAFLRRYGLPLGELEEIEKQNLEKGISR